MDTKTLAAAIAGFLLGGFTVSVAAALEEDGGSGGTHSTGPVEPAHTWTVPPLRQ